MGEVVRCGLDSGNCYGTDLFPLRVNINSLTTGTDRPFDAFPEYKELFMTQHLSSFLDIGGKVLLVFGLSAFEALEGQLQLKDIRLSDDDDDLRVFWERVLYTERTQLAHICLGLD